jgi:hypothetical protein
METKREGKLGLFGFVLGACEEARIFISPC